MPFFGDSRVMACDRRDMERWLRELVAGEIRVLPDGFEFAVEGVRMTVQLSDHAPRRVGLIAIPSLAVHFSYPPAARQAARAWITRFDRHTQRGGG